MSLLFKIPLIAFSRVLTSIHVPCRMLSDGNVRAKHQTTNIRSAPFYSYLKSRTEYHSTFYNSNVQNVSLAEEISSLNPVVQSFIDVARSVDPTLLTDSVHSDLVSNVLNTLTSITDEELLIVLNHMSLFSVPKSVNEDKYYEIWKSMDSECMNRMKQWDFDYLFRVADLLTSLQIAKHSVYHWTFMKKMFRKCDRLCKEHFVRFMLSLHVIKNLPKAINTYELEFNLNRLIDEMSADEVAIAIVTFTKFSKSIRDVDLTNKILDKACIESKTISSESVAAISRHSSFSCKMSNAESLFNFQSSLLPEVDRLSSSALIFLALSGLRPIITNRKLLERIAEKVESSLEYVGLKDLERLSTAITLFNIDCKSLCHKIVEQLQDPKRAAEIASNGRCIPIILYNVSVKQVLPEDLYKKVLSVDFFEDNYDGTMFKFPNELLTLDFTAYLEIEKYDGLRLTKKQSGYLSKKCMYWMKPETDQKLPEYQSVVYSMSKIFGEIIGGPEYIHVCNILPQFSSVALVYCTNADGDYVPVPSSFRDFEQFEVKFIADDPELKNVQFHAILICSHQCCIHNSTEIIGSVELHSRQLGKMGYIVHRVFVSDWKKLADDSHKQVQYLREIVGNLLDEQGSVATNF